RAYRLGKVEGKVGSRWRVADRRHPIPGQAGGVTHVRVQLLPDRGQGSQLTVALDLRVPRNARGQEGTLDIGGGQDYAGPVGATTAEPTSFDAQLRTLKDAPHNNEVLGALVLPTEDEDAPPAATARKRTPQIVTGQATIPFVIRQARKGAARGRRPLGESGGPQAGSPGQRRARLAPAPGLQQFPERVDVQ